MITRCGHLTALVVLALACSSPGKGPAGGTGGAPEDPEPDAAAGGKGGGGMDAAAGKPGPPDAPVTFDAAGNEDSGERPDQRPPTGGPDLGRDLSAADAGTPGQALHNYVFSVECPSPGTSAECNVPDARRLKTSAPITFDGDPTVTYKVRLHFCGPVEGRKYSGCKPSPFMNNSLLCLDGMPVPMGGGDQYVDTYPTYELKVSAPAHSYFVNSRDLRDTLMKIDYSADLEIKGGATLTFSTTSREQITFTSRKLNPPITCPGVPGLTQPFNGQFIHVTVLSATPQ